MSSEREQTIHLPPIEDFLDNVDDSREFSATPSKSDDSSARFSVEDTIGTIEDIKSDLRDRSGKEATFLDSVEKGIESVESSLQFLMSKFIPSSSSSNLDAIPVFLTDLCGEEIWSARKKQMMTKKQGVLMKSEGKMVEDALFPGFGEDASQRAVALPDKLEPLLLLDLVTRSQHFAAHLRSAWRKLFYSQETCSILQNSFWWIFLDYFKPDRNQQAILFNEIAECYVQLLATLDPKFKDEVYQQYPRCISQAIYCAFCHCFPVSKGLFNSASFKSHLVDVISEWMTGVRSSQSTLKDWPLDQLDPSNAESSSDCKVVNHVFTEKELLQLDTSRRDPLKPSSLRRQLKDNHDELLPVESEAVFEYALFSIFGRSPLVQHYLKQHSLSEVSSDQPAISRLQIKEMVPSTITYDGLLRNSASAKKARFQFYDREVKHLHQEMNADYKSHVAAMKEMKRENQRLLQHRHEVAMLAEKLIAKQRESPTPAD